MNAQSADLLLTSLGSSSTAQPDPRYI